MFLERLPNQGLIVFGSKRKQHTPLFQLAHDSLKIGKSGSRAILTQSNACQAIFAKYSSPQGVVTVENEHFLGGRKQACSEFGNLLCQDP